ncbi:zinc finger protein, putative [Bodo saltans]|uniref:Zinc finger protein, putative n=1 Tax=Bodo saltans TaxID=75058 RepID=A0A0S4IR12_BODSA|nr:zinc finger protein, putative [Bodo saltans]|eukprot:CUF27715.1 zinc finger protein, putative [Bodo saltans]
MALVIPHDDFCRVCNIVIKHNGSDAMRTNSWKLHVGSNKHRSLLIAANGLPPPAQGVPAQREAMHKTAVRCAECGGEVRYLTGNAASEQHSWHQHMNHSTVHAQWVATQRSRDPLPPTLSPPISDETAPSLSATTPPTTAQIEAHLERIAPSILCVVCTEPMIEAYSIEPCRHTLCKGCIDHLVQQNHRCPMCRGEIRTARKDLTLSNVISELRRAVPLNLPAMAAVVGTPNPLSFTTPVADAATPRARTTTAIAESARVSSAGVTPSIAAPLLPQVPQDVVRRYIPICRFSEVTLTQMLRNSLRCGHSHNEIVDTILAHNRSAPIAGR